MAPLRVYDRCNSAVKEMQAGLVNFTSRLRRKSLHSKLYLYYNSIHPGHEL